jgi:hypothetical protein
MSRIGTFLFGVAVGAALCYGSLMYHVLRTNEGFEIVPKLTPNFSETYVDVRNYKVEDWNQHKSLVAAIVHAGKGSLLGESAVDSLRDEAQHVLDRLGFRAPK